MSATTVERILFRVMPFAVLGIAYIGISVMTGSAWPWNKVVHEDGLRTLAATVFFVEHATRELVPDLLLALAVAGAVRYFFPPLLVSHGLSRVRVVFGAATMATLLAIVGGTIWTDGLHALLDNLSQLHTRPGATLVWGAHWRYHLIERFAQILLAFSVTGAIWMRRGRPTVSAAAGRGGLYALALLLFGVTTAVFGLDMDPFRDPAYLGHQLRELFTHSLVTLPLALGTCLTLARRFSPAGGPRSAAPIWPIALTGLVAVASGAFLLVASVMADAQSHGQTTGLAALLFPHFAEHALGYVLVPAAAGLLYVGPLTGQRAKGKGHREGRN